MQKHLLSVLRQIVVGATKKISPQEALDRKLFGPVYHGTSPENRDRIEREGFKIHKGERGDLGISHGYPIGEYALGRPAPVHHLGYGIYFTTVKAIGKKFNNNSARGLKIYYLDVPTLKTINFGVPNTMMKWWLENGYDMPEVKDYSSDSSISKQRVKATENLTGQLSSKYDAVWFKGKGLRTLLDGDQIVVFDTGRIYEIDPKLASGLEAGAKVVRKEDGMTGVVRNKRELGDKSKYHKGSKHLFEVKWKKGGVDYNVKDFEIEPVKK
jgi:hypothetical protein